MGITLRPYQEEAVEAVLAGAVRRVRRQLVVLPTGAGKTLVAAEVARRLGGRILFLVHRDELAQQAMEKFSLVWPEARAGLVKASSNDVDADVVVGSIQTLKNPNRLEAVKAAGEFSLVIADEAHHAVSESWQGVLTGVGVLPEPEEGVVLLGITATPFRADKIGLGQTFEKITYRRSILDMVRQGYLSDVRAFKLETKLDLSKVRTLGGDFNERDLALAVNTPRRNRVVVAGYKKHADGRKAVVFGVDVEHAHALAQAFMVHGVSALAVWGSMPESERREALRKFRDGEVQVLCNCSLLSEGWDEPSIGAVVMARPTRSPGLYIQAAGRGLRTHPGKTDCVVIDLDDIRHDLCHVGDLFGLERKLVSQDRPIVGDLEESGMTAQISYGRDLGESVDVISRPVDILGRSAFVWRQQGSRLMLEASPTKRIWVVPSTEGHYQVVLRESGSDEVVLGERLPLDYAYGVAEDYVRRERLEGFASRTAAWRSRPASLKQRAVLRGFNVDVWDGMTADEASELIQRCYNQQRLRDKNAPWRAEPASEKQIARLRKLHINPKPGLTRGEAADIMDRIFRKSGPKAVGDMEA